MIKRVSDFDRLVVIQWSVLDRGSPVTDFLVELRQRDGLTFTAENLNCKSNDPTVLATLSCTVPFSKLITSPYNLPYGSSVFARVTAANIYGTSETSL